MTKLSAGDKAPDFQLLNEEEKPVQLSDFKGQRLIIYFYPKDDTPGCTKEACSLRDGYKELRNLGFNVLGISPDKSQKHQKFIDKYDLPFSLGADTERKMLNDYGVWGLKKFMGREYDGVIRTTFVIDADGVITHVIEKVNTKDHANQIIELISE